jgi:hypothetical protein
MLIPSDGSWGNGMWMRGNIIIKWYLSIHVIVVNANVDSKVDDYEVIVLWY